MKITANFKNKEYSLQVVIADAKEYAGEAFGNLKWQKAGKVHVANFEIMSDGCNQAIEWKEHSQLAFEVSRHFTDVAKLMYDIQTNENLLADVRADLENAGNLSPDDVQELKGTSSSLLEMIYEDRTTLFQKRGI